MLQIMQIFLSSIAEWEDGEALFEIENLMEESV